MPQTVYAKSRATRLVETVLRAVDTACKNWWRSIADRRSRGRIRLSTAASHEEGGSQTRLLARVVYTDDGDENIEGDLSVLEQEDG
jgi:hypothetical protein